MNLSGDMTVAGRATAPARSGGRPTARRDESDERSPTRRCIVTRAVRARAELLRFVVGPDGVVVPDLAERLPGRGLWVSSRRDVLEKACAKNAFARAARSPARVPADLVDTVEARLADRCLRLVELARRAGEAVGGFEKVQEWLRTGRVKLLLVAVDGAPGSKEKLRRLAKGVPVAGLFSAAELGSAFGREQVVNAAVAHGGLVRRLQAEIFRLSGFRTADEGK